MHGRVRQVHQKGRWEVTYFVAFVKSRGMKLQDLAESLGLSKTALSKRIHGRTPWTLPEAQKASAVLGMTLDTFAGYFPLEG